MEDLALVVSGIILGLLLLGVGSVVLAVLTRKNKISKVWPLAAASILTIFGIIAWQGSDRLGSISVAWAVIASAIALWPGKK